LKRNLETLLKRNVDMAIEVDPSLIGGMVVYAGSRVYDGSLKGQLQELRREMAE
jgi:F0F1-type ATP synthase delta subunit